MHIVGRSLADAFGMLWQTLWALVLGFGLSGAVQAFVSRARMQRALGDHRARTVATAAVFGVASSSCSYAASALAKTLFARGADFTAAMTFMFASTNLVVELGVVLWLLVGWQFAVAELVGGTLMVVLLAVVLPRVVGPAEQGALRRRLQGTAGEAPDPGTREPGRARTLAGWADAAGYTIGDLTMLRRELLVGFLVAGFADAAVPTSFWRALFVSGHGLWSSVENVVVGPFLAVISFVCSVGNVPLAAALWHGGSTFGGVVAFVFADLVTLPLLAIYRRYYGLRLTLRLLAVFWATMSLAGLVTEYLFRAVGLAPHLSSLARGTYGHAGVRWDYTTVLDIVALAALALLFWLNRNRARFGGGAGFATDPVCGMQVEVAHAAASARRDGQTYYFCSEHCRDRFAGQEALTS